MPTLNHQSAPLGRGVPGTIFSEKLRSACPGHLVNERAELRRMLGKALRRKTLADEVDEPIEVIHSQELPHAYLRTPQE